MRTERPPASRVGPGGCALLLLAAFPSAGSGAVWESRDWAVTGSIAGSTGYDSNLTLAREGPGDVYIQAKPEFSLLRRNSSTEFHVDGSVTGTEFVNGRQPGQTDFGVLAAYAYPFGPDTAPLYRATGGWQRTSEPNQYLGQRIRHDRSSLGGEGYLPLTGKLGLRAELDAYHDDYKDDTLNSNAHARLFAGVAYERTPRLLTSLNLGYGHGESRPNRTDVSGAPVRSDEFYLTGKVRGELSPKVTGNAYLGLGQVRYRGGYSNRYTLPVAGADLTWGINPRRTVVLAAYSGADYTPDGQAVDTSRAFLAFTNAIVGSWQYTLRGGPARTVFRREATQSTDYRWEGGTELAYSPSKRFRVAVGLFAGTQDSDVREREFSRYVISLDSTFRF